MDEEQVNVIEEPEQLTAEDVQTAVENALSTPDATDIAVQDMAQTLVRISDDVALLSTRSAEEEQTENEELTYTVRLDSSQVETAKGAVRLACTEGLLLVILLALLCGLQLWQILQSRWARG